MYREDVLDAIERSDQSGLEEAFKTLVGWPNFDTITDTDAFDRQELLADVAERLIKNDSDRIMPGRLAEQIRDFVEDFDGATYAAGAAVVREHDVFFDRLDAEPKS